MRVKGMKVKALPDEIVPLGLYEARQDGGWTLGLETDLQSPHSSQVCCRYLLFVACLARLAVHGRGIPCGYCAIRKGRRFI